MSDARQNFTPLTLKLSGVEKNTEHVVETPRPDHVVEQKPANNLQHEDEKDYQATIVKMN